MKSLSANVHTIYNDFIVKAVTDTAQNGTLYEVLETGTRCFNFVSRTFYLFSLYFFLSYLLIYSFLCFLIPVSVLSTRLHLVHPMLSFHRL